MKSAVPGRNISRVEATNVSGRGFWLLLEGRELFVPFEHFPWFADASIRQIMNVQLPALGHLYWPDLDVDLAVESIEHPERFPLLSRVQYKQRAAGPGTKRGFAPRPPTLQK